MTRRADLCQKIVALMEQHPDADMAFVAVSRVSDIKSESEMFSAATPDGLMIAAIEAMVDQYIKFLIRQSKLKDIAFSDLCCATIEAAARLSVATLVAAGVGVTPESERVIRNMVRYFEASMIARLSGTAPGHEDTIGATVGSA